MVFWMSAGESQKLSPSVDFLLSNKESGDEDNVNALYFQNNGGNIIVRTKASSSGVDEIILFLTTNCCWLLSVYSLARYTTRQYRRCTPVGGDIATVLVLLWKMRPRHAMRVHMYSSSPAKCSTVIRTVVVYRAVAKTRCTLLEHGQSKVKGRNESQTSTTEAE